MATAEAPTRSLSDPDLKAQIQLMRRTDNITNWWYIVTTYAYLALVIGGAVWFFENRTSFGWHWALNLPVALIAVVLVGAGQHRLSSLAHEGSHYILFRNRTLNDLAADILTMFPLFASIHHYRLQHLAHHQFTNDPDRDPDVSQLQMSGHWLGFPLLRAAVIRALIRQLWPLRLIRFMYVRAQYNATGTEKNPYLIKGQKPSSVAVRIGVLALLLSMGALTITFYLTDEWWMLPVVAGTIWLVVALVFLRLPDRMYHQSKLKSVIPARWVAVLRSGYGIALFTTLAVVTKLTGVPGAVYFVVLWVVPIFTAFAFFMILRQLVQHGNGGRGWINNTRTFFVSPLIRFAVFPFGQDFHLPHHMYATVPHYRLRRLHKLLMEYPEYRAEALEVHGYFLSPEKPKIHPTVVDVLGPEYAPRTTDVYIDDEAIAPADFTDRESLVREAELSKGKANELRRTITGLCQ